MLFNVSVISVVSIFQFLGCVADSFNDTTILSGAHLLDCEFGNRSLAYIERNHYCRRHLTQKHAAFTRGDSATFQFRHRFHSMFSGQKLFLDFFLVQAAKLIVAQVWALIFSLFPSAACVLRIRRRGTERSASNRRTGEGRMRLRSAEK